MVCLPVLLSAIIQLAFLQLIYANPSVRGCSKRGIELSCPMDTRIAITDSKLTPCDFTSGGSVGENAMWSQCNLRQGCGFEGMFLTEVDVSYKCVPYIPGYVHDMCAAHVEDSPLLYLSSPHYASPGKRAPCICGAFMTKPTNITIYISNDLLEDQELSIEMDGRTTIHVTQQTPGKEYGRLTRTVQTFIRFGFFNGNPRMGGSFLLLYEVEGDRAIKFSCEKVPVAPVFPSRGPQTSTTYHLPPWPGLSTERPSFATTSPVSQQSSENDDKMVPILGAVIPVVLIGVVAGLITIFTCRRRRNRQPKKKIVASVALDLTIANNLEKLRRTEGSTSPDVMMNRTYGLVEGDNLITSTTRPDNRQQKEYHYACVDLEEAKYANDLGDRKYANVSKGTSLAIDGAIDSEGCIEGAAQGGTRGKRGRSGPVPAPRTLKPGEDKAKHFYSNFETAEYIKCTNLEREELMKENDLFQEIRQTLKDRAKGGAPVPAPRGSKRTPDPGRFYSNLSGDRDQLPSGVRGQLQSASSTGSHGDTFQIHDIDQSMDSGYNDQQVALDDLAGYQPIEFGNVGRPTGTIQHGRVFNVERNSKSDQTSPERDLSQTECTMIENDLYESADGPERDAGLVHDSEGDEEGLLSDNELYQAVDVSAGEVQAIMKENDIYQPLNMCRESYMKENDIYQDF
ncbi:uncharacterized protein LOC135483494 [Lineus longissimus]|uniref:uncharacterized protein LOC135483494 n=1 Tax=Lineus longissimus TaxID=88925 RepID=UPI002B4C3938